MDEPDLEHLTPLERAQHILDRAQHNHQEALRRHDEAERRAEEMRAQDAARRTAHAEHMASLDAIIERQKASNRRLDEQLAEMQERQSPEALEAIRAQARAEMECTLADLERWLGRDSYPTWMHAAYADLVQRLVRMDERLDELETSMGLLHTKMEMIIGHLVADERQDRAD